MAEFEAPVKKTIKHAGSGPKPTFEDGTRITFHFKTQRTDSDDESDYIDDSTALRKPMELILGKEFKLPVWEECLKSMALGEVSEFIVDKRSCINYFLVAKAYRQYAGIMAAPESHHCCGTMLKERTGCPKLDLLLEKPCDLKFIFELVNVEKPGTYEKESWSMTPEEKLAKVPVLKEQGNELFKQGKIAEAAQKYFEAISHLEALLLREKPGGEEFLSIELIKWPILLNYAQCKLSLGEYYEVIKHCSDILAKDPKNSKALYRRAKAHMGAWNPDLARKDFLNLLEIEPALKPTIEKCLKDLEQDERKKDERDKLMLRNMFSN
ncbi:AH receptor-interacting protein [Galendromus occidentalis]|uniref:AH receptor-interacting protein n=1 Tax=Galendromus occidentalis TaxID=34638 RepID=A0AAJ6VW54_9ACAR|nr:AH receptor-interacting protein [Galendromus occidentalis]